MKAWVPSSGDVLIVLGLLTVSAGAWHVFPPAGLMVAGAGLCGLGILRILGGR